MYVHISCFVLIVWRFIIVFVRLVYLLLWRYWSSRVPITSHEAPWVIGVLSSEEIWSAVYARKCNRLDSFRAVRITLLCAIMTSILRVTDSDISPDILLNLWDYELLSYLLHSGVMYCWELFAKVRVFGNYEKISRSIFDCSN